MTSIFGRSNIYIFSVTSRLRAPPLLVETHRPHTLELGALRGVPVTDMARVEVITTGAGGRAEVRGERPGLRASQAHEVTVRTGGAGHLPTPEVRGETEHDLKQ